MTAPFDRSAAIARVTFLMPGFTDFGLKWLIAAAEKIAKYHSRDLTPATLAAEQRAREDVCSELRPIDGGWSTCGESLPCPVHEASK